MLGTKIDYNRVFKILEDVFATEMNNFKIVIGTGEGLIFFTNLDQGEKLVASFKKVLDIIYSLNYKPTYLFKKILLQTKEKYMILSPLSIHFEKYVVWIEFPKGFSSKKCLVSAENIVRKIKRLFKSNNMDLTGIEPVTS